LEAAIPLYDSIGEGYDATRRADPFLVGRLRTLLSVQNDGSYVDVACGTGNYTVALAETGGRWAGVDCSSTMIEAARGKSKNIDWCIGDVAALSFDDESVDGATCVLAMHHFPDRIAALREVRRVLRRGGRFLIFTADPGQMRHYWLNHYFPEPMARAIEQMPDVAAVENDLRAAGLEPRLREPYAVRADLQDFFLYSGKLVPDRYLDARFRAGISTFAALAAESEVRTGCARLAEDIESGRISQITAAYDGPHGDYIFISADAN
jgi:SAM-dependent methyltransferase